MGELEVFLENECTQVYVLHPHPRAALHVICFIFIATSLSLCLVLSFSAFCFSLCCSVGCPASSLWSFLIVPFFCCCCCCWCARDVNRSSSRQLSCTHPWYNTFDSQSIMTSLALSKVCNILDDRYCYFFRVGSDVSIFKTRKNPNIIEVGFAIVIARIRRRGGVCVACVSTIFALKKFH
jgi:hypothetical protein